MNGAQIIVKCLENENIPVIFGYPGAAICPFYEALTDSSIHHILVRHEQNAGHAASGYARISGKPGVCVVTSGPGATNLITAIAAAYMDSVPIVAISGQVRSELLGRDVFQEADITGAVAPFIKNSYLVKDVSSLPRIFKEAFHIASTGRPGPVLIDIPLDIQLAQWGGEFKYPERAAILGYNPRMKGNALQIKKAVEALKESKRPVICAGGGVISGKSKLELRRFAEKMNIPVVSTMMGLGALPSAHPLYLGMIGTHGVYPANYALRNADLLLIMGARVGDRAVASDNQIAESAKIIHVDIDPAEIGKNRKVFIPIVGDCRSVINDLIEKTDFICPPEWSYSVQKIKNDSDWNLSSCDRPGFINPHRFMKLLSQYADEKAILAADVGQNQIWSANNFEIRQGRFLTSGGMGVMGYSIPAAIGAKTAKKSRQVIAVCGDGAFQMCMMELATAVQDKINIKIVIMRNDRLGMVSEFKRESAEKEMEAITLKGNPDFIALAASYGIRGKFIDSNDQIEGAITELLKSDEIFLLECRVSPDQRSIHE